MNKLVSSIAQQNPIKWFRKIRGFRLVYTPLLAIVIFTAVMGVILGTLQLQEKHQQEAAIFRELSFAKQRIQLRMINNSETLSAISRDYVSGYDQVKIKESAVDQAIHMVASNHEIAKVIWLSPSRQIQWQVPAVNTKKEALDRYQSTPDVEKALQRTVNLSLETNRPAFSQFIPLESNSENTGSKDVRNVFWEVIPNPGADNSNGIFAVLYTTQGLLGMIPSELKAMYRFTLIADEEKVIAISSDKNTPRRALSNQTTLDMGAFSPNLTLRIDSYPPPTNVTFRMLIAVTLGLSAFVIWSLWSVLKQMQVRQEAEANLRKETSFRNAMENSTPVGIRAHDMEKRITYVNRAFCEMTGWSSEELMGLAPPFEFWPDSRKDELSEKMNEAFLSSFSSENKIGIEGMIVRRDGAQIHTRTFISPLINEKGIQTGWVASLIDISEPKKIREELVASQDRFVTVMEGLDAAVSVVSIDKGELLFANRFYREHFGEGATGHFQLAGGEPEQNSMRELGEELNDFDQTIPPSYLLQEAESEEIELPGVTNTWYEVRRRFIPWVDGHLAQILIATDITERKHADDISRQQDERMQFTSRLTTMGEMASSLAHELNQPLSAISNYCMGVVKRLQGYSDPAIEKDILPALEKASEQAHRAATIIQRIRGFVKRSEPQRQSTDIALIINDAVGLVEIEAHRQRLSITSNVATDLPMVELDPVLILQVLVNLLKNALDSVRDVYPLSSRWSAPPVTISADLDTGSFPATLRIQVTDAGSGIPENIIERMYEPFFSTKNDGMGMGLNICRSIVESHHGRLWAKNHMDAEHTKMIGCTFTILLPIDSPDSERAIANA
ncbi:PAS/PAC sensor signal transduction histidine kinase [Polynucleobacter meluiroseus]|uniref:histidine kinase n=1 Tax=Polynucleobacter meluiroseus TaxID=1938814 RepID=A0A240DZQ4_9BURK|nr:PAS domain-containing sensor histidine kinase [Polynucleobacter meluiroseus]SNX28493.1 PAS/PAC sensor signal transduction histidine kinase [Polynucleobacter meluiroseus]